MTDYKKELGTVECEEWFVLSLSEVTSSFGISKETITEIIDEGIISAQEDNNKQLCFDKEAVRCIRTVLQLNRDLGVNLAGAGLVLELLKKIDYLEGLLYERHIK